MAELIILLVVCVGLCRRNGRGWEWSRRRLRLALGTAAQGGEATVARVRRSLPGLFAQCLRDVRSLVDDTLGILDPKARSRIAAGTRTFLASERARARRLTASSGRSRLATSGPGGSGPASPLEPGPSAFARLQRRYLDGAISLEEYIAESRRLQPPASD